MAKDAEEGSMTKSALFLFAPKFSDFGVDVARAAAIQHGFKQIHGICSGHPKLAGQVSDKLGDLAGETVAINDMEVGWAKRRPDRTMLERIETLYPRGTMGRTILADRRVGVGFLRDGITRPDRLAAIVKKRPQLGPQAYVAELYRFLEQVFDRTKPETVFCYAVAGAPAMAMAIVAQARAIPFATLRPTRIGQRYTVDNGLEVDLQFAVRNGHNTETTQEIMEARQQAKQYIRGFRTNPTFPDYHVNTRRQLDARRPIPYISRLLSKGLLVWIKGVLSGNGRRLEAAYRRFYDAQRMWSEVAVDRSYFSDFAEVKRPFIYFPLHVAPEASTMVLAPGHTNQVAVVEALAKALPAGMDLVVKEHRPMLGHRPRGYYETVSQIPRTYLLSPDNDGLELVRQARLTAVITGTAAWEAFCLGKPPLVLGNAAFLGLGEGAVHETDLSKIPEAIETALNTCPVSENKLEDYVTRLIARSFDMPASLIWGQYSKHVEEERKHIAQEIAKRLPTPS